MHKATVTTTTHDGNGLFTRKESMFGSGGRYLASRPSTSSGASSTTTIEPHEDSAASVAPEDTGVFSHPAIPPRKASFSFATKTHQGPFTSRKTSIATANLAYSPERRPAISRSRSTKQHTFSKSTERRHSLSQSHGDNSTRAQSVQPYAVDRASILSTKPFSEMLATSLNRDLRPGTSYHGPSFGVGMVGTGGPPPPQSPTLETITYQHIQEMAVKRISTLDYLRKAHDGRVYWFNTLLFNKPDLARMPYFDSRKLARRATNYLLLGLSLPTILDLNSSTPADFLRTLNSLLAEFEAYQQIHPPDGSNASSLSRARLPQMFKRATTTGGKGRRTSSAADIGLPMSNDAHDSKSVNGSMSAASSSTSFPSGDNDLLPGEEYSYLLTPSLPFDPDFYETFATLCDVLIDCYTRLMSLIASPKDCGPHIAEMFTKADGRIRKIIVQGVVKEFEDSSRSGLKSEVAGIGKVVLGGLM